MVADRGLNFTPRDPLCCEAGAPCCSGGPGGAAGVVVVVGVGGLLLVVTGLGFLDAGALIEGVVGLCVNVCVCVYRHVCICVQTSALYTSSFT